MSIRGRLTPAWSIRPSRNMRGYPASLQYGFRKTSDPCSVAGFRDQACRSLAMPSLCRDGACPVSGDAASCVSTGKSLRRNREEIPGSFGRRGCAVCDVVGAGSSSSSGSNSSARPDSSPRASRDSNSANRQPAPPAPSIRASNSLAAVRTPRPVFSMPDTGRDCPAGTLPSV